MWPWSRGWNSDPAGSWSLDTSKCRIQSGLRSSSLSKESGSSPGPYPTQIRGPWARHFEVSGKMFSRWSHRLGRRTSRRRIGGYPSERPCAVARSRSDSSCTGWPTTPPIAFQISRMCTEADTRPWRSKRTSAPTEQPGRLREPDRTRQDPTERNQIRQNFRSSGWNLWLPPPSLSDRRWSRPICLAGIPGSFHRCGASDQGRTVRISERTSPSSTVAGKGHPSRNRSHSRPNREFSERRTRHPGIFPVGGNCWSRDSWIARKTGPGISKRRRNRWISLRSRSADTTRTPGCRVWGPCTRTRRRSNSRCSRHAGSSASGSLEAGSADTGTGRPFLHPACNRSPAASRLRKRRMRWTGSSCRKPACCSRPSGGIRRDSCGSLPGSRRASRRASSPCPHTDSDWKPRSDRNAWSGWRHRSSEQTPYTRTSAARPRWPGDVETDNDTDPSSRTSPGKFWSRKSSVPRRNHRISWSLPGKRRSRPPGGRAPPAGWSTPGAFLHLRSSNALGRSPETDRKCTNKDGITKTKRPPEALITSSLS